MSKIEDIIRSMQSTPLPSNYWLGWCGFRRVPLPELIVSREIIQHNGQSVWEHTLIVLDLLSIKNPITLFAGLFHDLGKTCIPLINDSSLPRFPGHADKSSNIAKIRLAQWGGSPYLVDRVSRLISTHMFDISQKMRERTIRKFVADVGIDNIENWFALRRADSASYSHYYEYEKHIIDPFYKIITTYLNTLPKGDNKLQLSSKPNISIGGKELKKQNTPLSIRGNKI